MRHQSRTITRLPAHLAIAAMLSAASAVACSGNRATTEAPDAGPPMLECVSYERELRTCFSAVGAPAQAANTLAATLASSDEAERLRMESACARDRLRLRASCQ